MEVLITTDHFVENKTSMTVWNPQTGTRLLTLRGPPAASQSLVFIRGDEGFAVVEEGKPFIHLWQTGQSLQTSKRILCPGKPGPMAMSPDGNFLVVAIEEKIHVWQPSTGRIVTVISAGHYRAVRVLRFNDDGTYLISAGEDGMVLAWKFINLVSGGSPTPTYSWADHSLPVNDVHVGTGGRKATVFSVGEDRFIKIYSLMTGTLLLSVAYPLPLTSVVADRAEMGVFLGASDGTIYQLNIATPPRSLEHHVSSDAAADGILRKHTERITGLTISADGSKLASSDEGGWVHLWSLENKQAIKTILNPPSSTARGKISNIRFWLGDPETLKGGKKPLIAFPDVPKLIESSDDSREYIMTVWNRFDQSSTPMDEDLLQSNNGNTASSSSMAEINNLKVKLARCEDINRGLHNFYVENLLGEAPPTAKKMKHK